MSIRPDIEAWKRRFGACLLVALGALMLTGARDITHELRQRNARLEQVHAQLAEWSRHLAGSPIPGPGQDVASRHALFLVRTCALPSRQP
jgi:hypothetical protein